jgi:hypothetical protein
MTTSVDDCAHWMRLHLGRGKLDGERLLAAPLISELHAPHVHIASQSPYSQFDAGRYGLGFQCTSYRAVRPVWHGGGLPAGMRR